MATKTKKPTKAVKTTKTIKKTAIRVASKPAVKPRPAPAAKARHVRVAYSAVGAKSAGKVRAGPTFAYMKAPGAEQMFEVGDTVEVFCDHEKNNDRVRGWIKGIVVQVDNKMVAVQFRSNVFLTDGWMVPDRILWYPVTSEQIRAVATGRKAVRKDLIPEY